MKIVVRQSAEGCFTLFWDRKKRTQRGVKKRGPRGEEGVFSPLQQPRVGTRIAGTKEEDEEVAELVIAGDCRSLLHEIGGSNPSLFNYKIDLFGEH